MPVRRESGRAVTPPAPKRRSPGNTGGGHPSRGGKTVGGGTGGRAPRVYRSPTPRRTVTRAPATHDVGVTSPRPRSRLGGQRVPGHTRPRSRIGAEVRRRVDALKRTQTLLDLVDGQTVGQRVADTSGVTHRVRVERAQRERAVAAGNQRRGQSVVRESERKAQAQWRKGLEGRGRGAKLPDNFRSEAATRGRAATVVRPIGGGKKRVLRFRDQRDTRGRTLAAHEQASAAKSRRRESQQRYKREKGKAAQRLAKTQPQRLLRAQITGRKAPSIYKLADRQALRRTRRSERKQRRLDEEAIARYGTHASSKRAKGAERAHERRLDEQRAKLPLGERVKRGANDLVKGFVPSVKQTAEGYADYVTGLPGYAKDIAAGRSHAEAARRNAPKMVKLSHDFREKSALGQTITGDVKGAGRTLKAHPLESGVELAATAAGASRLLTMARPKHTARVTARPDKKVRAPTRAEPRSKQAARTRLKRERARAKGDVAARQAGREPPPRHVEQGDRSRSYSKSRTIRVAQKLREDVAARRGRDPSLMSNRQTKRRRRKGSERDVQTRAAGGLKREVELEHTLRKVTGRGVRGHHARLAAYLATGIVRDGSLEADLKAVARTVRDEQGPGSKELADVQRLLAEPEFGATKRVRAAAATAVREGRVLDAEMERYGITEPGAAAGRAQRIGPLKRGEAAFVHAGDELPDESLRQVGPKTSKGPGRGKGPVRRKKAQPRSSPPEPRAGRPGASQAPIRARLAEIESELRDLGTNRKQQGRTSAEAHDPVLEELVADYHRKRAEYGSEHPLARDARAKVAARQGGEGILTGRPYKSKRQRAPELKRAKQLSAEREALQRKLRDEPREYVMKHGTDAKTAAELRQAGDFSGRRRDTVYAAADEQLARRYGNEVVEVVIRPRKELRTDSPEFAELAAGKTGTEIEEAARAADYDAIVGHQEGGYVKALDPSIVTLKGAAGAVGTRNRGLGGGHSRDQLGRPVEPGPTERQQRAGVSPKPVKRTVSHETPAAPRASRARREAPGRAEGAPPTAGRSGFIGQRQSLDPELGTPIVGLRFAVPEREPLQTPGQPTRYRQWTGQDVVSPEPGRDPIRATLQENARAVTQASKYQAVARWGSGIGPADKVEAWARAERAAGREVVVLDASPRLLMRLGEADTLPESELRALTKPDGPVRLALPKEVYEAWVKQMSTPGTVASAGRLVTRAFLRATLPLSVLWHAGNMVDLALRAAVGNAGPATRNLWLDVERELRRLDPHRADTAFALMQGHFGSRRGVIREPAVRDLTARRRNGLERALNDLSQKVGDSPARHAARPLNEVIDKAFDFGAASERVMVQMIMGRALVDGAVSLGLKQADHVAIARRLLTDERYLERFQRATLELVGDYTKNAAARTFSPIDPFWAWFKAANRFVAYTLPVKHPLKAAAIAAMVQLTADERARLGLNYYLTQDEAKRLHLPAMQDGFLAGGLPVGDGYIPVMPFTSLGEISRLLPESSRQGRGNLDAPVAALVGRVLPFVQEAGPIALGRKGTIGSLAGKLASGETKSPIPQRRQPDEANTLGVALGRAFVPGFKQGKQTADSEGGLRNPALNPFAPRKPFIKPKRKRGTGIPPERKRRNADGSLTLIEDSGKQSTFRKRPKPGKSVHDVFNEHPHARSEAPAVSSGQALAAPGSRAQGGVAPVSSYQGVSLDELQLGGAPAGAGRAAGPVKASRGGEVLPRSVYDAINAEMTPSFDRWARKTYGIDGKTLLAKVAAVEGGGSIDEGTSATSYAGARGPFQFIASTRAGYIRQHGVDPWKSDRQAARGAMIHLRGTGVRGYNPGMAAYEGMVLGAKVNTRALAGSGGVRAPANVTTASGRTDRKQPGRSVRLPGTDLSRERARVAIALVGGKIDLLEFATQMGALRDVKGELVQLPGSKPGPRVKGAKGGSVKGVRAGKDGKGGARILVKWASQGYFTSGERTPAENAAAGGAPGSDHLTTKRWASAADMRYGSGRAVAKRLGLGKVWRPGTYDRHLIVVDGRTYSVQILENVEGHYDHTHLGIQRVK